MEKNTCWFFGDSFTQCLALNHGSEYCNYMGFETDIKPWTTIVSEYLDMNKVVIAKGGRSSSTIMSKVLENVSNFKKGDWVIMTDSPYVRIEGVDFKNKEITTYNNEQFCDDNANFNEGDEWTDGIPVPIQKTIKLVDYVSEFILPFENEWASHNQKNFINLSNLFRLAGINSVFWSYYNWYKFTPIREETNGTIIDDHWGKIGSNEFAKYLIENIENKNYILDNKNLTWKKTMI